MLLHWLPIFACHLLLIITFFAEYGDNSILLVISFFAEFRKDSFRAFRHVIGSIGKNKFLFRCFNNCFVLLALLEESIVVFQLYVWLLCWLRVVLIRTPVLDCDDRLSFLGKGRLRFLLFRDNLRFYFLSDHDIRLLIFLLLKQYLVSFIWCAHFCRTKNTNFNSLNF